MEDLRRVKKDLKSLKSDCAASRIKIFLFFFGGNRTKEKD